MAAEEEDVIIPNSPLSHYLQGLENSGAANLIEETTSVSKKDQDRKSLLTETKPKGLSVKKEYFSGRCVTHIIGSFFYLPYYIFFCATLLSSSLLRCNLNTENEILIREDEAFLESLLKSESINKRSPVRKLIQIWGTLTIVFFMFYYLIATNKDLFEIFYICYLITCAYAVVSFLCACIVVYCIILDISLNRFYGRTVQILKLMRRSIRLVQESELIARGFTNASAIGAAERIELSSVLPFNSSNKQCLQLRKCLFKWMKEIFLDYRAQTVTLIQNVPLDPLYSFSTSLAQLEMEEFGALLTCDLDSPEITVVTDGFSISSLKTMYRLMEIQISEYFRYSCVILYFISADKKKDCCEQIRDLYNVKTAMNVLSKASKPLLIDVEEVYRFYQSIEASYVSDSLPKTSTSKKTPVSKLKITVHNMCLHLKAALLQAVEVENLFSATDLSLPRTLESVESLMHIVNNEVSAFQDCSKESSEIIYDLLHPQKDVSTQNVLPSESIKGRTDEVLPEVVEKCDVEREIEDEVFEAMILTCAADSFKKTACRMEDLKMNVELTASLLTELKNVLVPKADEHRIREMLALAKKSKDVDLESSPIENIQSSVQTDGSEQLKFESQQTEGSEQTKFESRLTDGSEQMKFGSHLTDMSKQTKFESQPTDGCEQIKSESRLTERSKQMKFESQLMEKDDSVTSDVQATFSNPLPKAFESFATSIALIAAQRQKRFGLSSDEYVVEGNESSDSDVSNSD